MAQFKEIGDVAFNSLMASSEVDQKFLGRYAKETHHANPFLSAMLYKVLGLSVLLSKKLIRARRLRRLDTTRDTKSLQLYHHIIWLAREGLTILEEYILAMVDNYAPELRVLAHKLRASFYHIFVLFHNQPSIHIAAIPAARGDGSLRRSPEMNGRPIDDPGPLPPGLAPVSVPKPSATFLLPARNYIPDASSYFSHASELADAHLFGSHPIRLSVKTEYAAYLYDCLHDGEASRKLAQAAIRDVYNAPEGMDDEMFEDSAEMVGILGKMMRRGLNSRNPAPTTSRPAGQSESKASGNRAPREERGGNGSSPSSSTTTPASSSTPRARNGGGSGSTTEPPPPAPSTPKTTRDEEKERERALSTPKSTRERERDRDKRREKESSPRDKDKGKDRRRERESSPKGKEKATSPTRREKKTSPSQRGKDSSGSSGSGKEKESRRRKPRAQGRR